MSPRSLGLFIPCFGAQTDLVLDVQENREGGIGKLRCDVSTEKGRRDVIMWTDEEEN